MASLAAIDPEEPWADYMRFGLRKDRKVLCGVRGLLSKGNEEEHWSPDFCNGHSLFGEGVAHAWRVGVDEGP